MTNMTGATGGPAIVTHKFECGCEAEGLTSQTRLTFWVPLTGCGEHCPCVGCKRVRAAEIVRGKLAAARPYLGAVKGWEGIK